jgi:Protein of unknown function (DUF1579)
MKTLVTVALVLLLACPILAQEPQMTAEQKAEMEAFMRAATPGAQHSQLASSAGTWNAKVRYWPAPGAPSMDSEGVSENRMILGGRYLEQRFTGTMMGMPFEGLGYTGYDNVRKQHWSTWVDNSTTGLMTSWAPKGGDGLSMEGSMVDALTGKDIKVKSKVVIKSADEHVFEMWGPDRKGKQFKMMEITYTRKK